MEMPPSDVLLREPFVESMLTHRLQWLLFNDWASGCTQIRPFLSNGGIPPIGKFGSSLAKTCRELHCILPNLPYLPPFICSRPTLWSDTSTSYLFLLPSHFILLKHFPNKSLAYLITSWPLLKRFSLAQLSKWVCYLNISFPS